MKNHYFLWDQMFGWESEPIYDDWFSESLKSLRPGRDFFPDRPLVLEMYHTSSYDRKSGKYVKGPAAIAVFNTPELGRDGRIAATARWPYGTMDEFWHYFKNTKYRKFTAEHRAGGDFNTPYGNPPGELQAVRTRFVNL